MSNYIFETLTKGVSDETKAFVMKVVREHNMIGEDDRVVPVKDYLRSVNANFPELRNAAIDVKMDKVRSILINRDAYNSIMIVNAYQDESSLVKRMSNSSIIVVIRYGKAAGYEFLNKEEYLDMIDCNVDYLQEYVEHDGSELDTKLEQYEKLAEYMDLPDLNLRKPENALEEPMVYADFKEPYGFYTYAGDFDHESRWIEGEKSRKNLLRRTRSQYTKQDVKAKFEYVEAILQFIKEHPEEEDLFDDLDVVIDPETGEKHRDHSLGKYDIVDVNPDWIGRDDDGDIVYSKGYDDEDREE